MVILKYYIASCFCNECDKVTLSEFMTCRQLVTPSWESGLSLTFDLLVLYSYSLLRQLSFLAAVSLPLQQFPF